MTDPRDRSLDRDDLLDDPLALFAAWFAAARDAGVPAPEVPEVVAVGAGHAGPSDPEPPEPSGEQLGLF